MRVWHLQDIAPGIYWAVDDDGRCIAGEETPDLLRALVARCFPRMVEVQDDE